MKGKIPHDFSIRRVLDGREEFYTQHRDYQPTEQKFTLEQVKVWLFKHRQFEIIKATQDAQTHFQLKHQVILPELSTIHFEKCHLTYLQDYHFEGSLLITHTRGLSIDQHEVLSLQYYSNESI